MIRGIVKVVSVSLIPPQQGQLPSMGPGIVSVVATSESLQLSFRLNEAEAPRVGDSFQVDISMLPAFGERVPLTER